MNAEKDQVTDWFKANSKRTNETKLYHNMDLSYYISENTAIFQCHSWHTEYRIATKTSVTYFLLMRQYSLSTQLHNIYCYSSFHPNCCRLKPFVNLKLYKSLPIVWIIRKCYQEEDDPREVHVAFIKSSSACCNSSSW